MVGFQDSLDLNPLALKARDWVVLSLMVVEIGLGIGDLWWCFPFFLVRLFTYLGGFGGRCGKWSRLRFAFYMLWTLHQAYGYYVLKCADMNILQPDPHTVV